MIKKFLRHKLVGGLSLAAVLFSAGGFLWAYFALRGVRTTPLILHFNDISGITSIGGISNLIFVGIFGLVITIMNVPIAIELDARDRFLGKLAAVSTLIFAILLFIAFSAIINVN
jgi:hypothetical protein